MTRRKLVTSSSRLDRLEKVRLLVWLAWILEGLDLACIDLYDQYHAVPLSLLKRISDEILDKIIGK